MNRLLITALACIAVSASQFSAVREAAAEEADAKHIEFFEAKIRPVLVKHCYECHSSHSKPARGGLLLDTRSGIRQGGDSGASVVPNDPDKSPLLEALRYESFEMPPKGKLPDSVIKDFETWISAGAADPRDGTATVRPSEINYEEGLKFWAFQRPVTPPLPDVSDSKRISNDIDRFVVAKLEAAGLASSKPATRRTLIRRAWFDLIGLPPEPEAVEKFLNDPADTGEAFARVIDELLESPHYGERWGRYWLDVARYGEDQAHTFKARRYPQGYLYRDWVVNALNDDMPYDRFLKYQIAGDLLNEPNQHERLAALGLFALGPVYYQDNGEKDKALADEWDDRVDTLMRGTQGLTIACARCHDHKYDPLSMTDYYGLLGVFASSKYQERPAVAPQVVAARAAADAQVKERQLDIDRFLSTASRDVRMKLIEEIPKYAVAGWKFLNQRKADPKNKKLSAKLAKEEKVSEELLKRWAAWLQAKPDSGAVKADRPYFTTWKTLIASQDAKTDLSKDADAIAAVSKLAETLKNQATTLLPKKSSLFQTFGENVAFVSQTDQAEVVPGVIPLGNLFDDSHQSTLNSALSTDKFKATPNNNSLGVDRVAAGWGTNIEIASGIQFNFSSIGSDGRAYGSIINDAWNTQGGIRTEGSSAGGNLPRTEQGIGMHANALITFDLEEIRRSGLIPSDRTMTFKVDRAGINDDAFGSNASAHIAVIVTKPHAKPEVYDAVLSATLNGKPAMIDENDRVYYLAGNLPDPISADGTFVSFNITLPPEARYVTLIATGAGSPDENSISSDHVVFSGARLEYEPVPGKLAAADSPKTDASIDSNSETDRIDATLLSELLSDKGLLAIPPKEAEQLLEEDAKAELKTLRATYEDRKKAAAAINVLMAHSLSDGNGNDMPIYLAGDPKKKGGVAPRAFPAIYTNGSREPFASKGSGRLELAEAIASPENPLTARVIVNRIWAGHFGAGLVRTVSNFGKLGERPSHPDLLDWLAVRFVESGWSTKALHRQIMLSATYQQSGEFNAKNYETDPANRLLWRMNRRRLEVEPWRDSMLAVAGTLDRTFGGKSMPLSNGNNKRRTIYGFISRHQLDDLLRLFDFPDPNITAGQRTVTTVPLQQLFVLNSEFMMTQARALADRLNRESNSDTVRLQRAYELLYSRPPTDDEISFGLQFLKDAATDNDATLKPMAQFCTALLGANEFSFVD